LYVNGNTVRIRVTVDVFMANAPCFARARIATWRDQRQRGGARPACHNSNFLNILRGGPNLAPSGLLSLSGTALTKLDLVERVLARQRLDLVRSHGRVA